MALLVLASVLAAAEAGTLAVTYQDCGAQHAQVTDLQPQSIETGTTATLTGTGTCDEDLTSAYFTATVSAQGVQLGECSGDASEDIVCPFPMGLGKITVKALSFPIAMGTVSIDVEVKTSSLIPASAANVDVHVTAEDQNGESVICLDVHTEQDGPTPSPAPTPTPTPTPPSPTPDPGYRTITPSSNTNLCLDVPGGDAFNGNQLWLWECNGEESQRWRFDSRGTIRYAPDESKCIDAGDMSDGTQLYMWDCNGQPQQTWDAEATKPHSDPPMRLFLADTSTCLDYYGDWESNGQPLHVWECSGDWNQVWTLHWYSPTLSVV